MVLSIIQKEKNGMSQNYSKEYGTEEYRGESARYEPSPQSMEPHAAARGLGRMFALHPAPTFFVILGDSMVSAVNIATVEISAPALWLIASIVTAVVVFMAQKKWAGDDQESAFIKALMVAFLVALPTPFPSFLTVPSAIVGTVQMLRRKP